MPQHVKALEPLNTVKTPATTVPPPNPHHCHNLRRRLPINSVSSPPSPSPTAPPLSFFNCPSLCPPHRLPDSHHSFSAAATASQKRITFLCYYIF
ncbi:hypothetical protein HID58_029457 [Brassica napus]|uniref:Uncharacterized protein n=1 Tax=Brassica napus TaxID=3708 RepID=A0ABQ8CD62_BRANA|nr:hypothetical protein HID58_029457 [Brassica napus]